MDTLYFISACVISKQKMNITVADRNTSFTLHFEDIHLLNKDFEQTTFNNIMVTVNVISILVVNSLVLIWLKSKVINKQASSASLSPFNVYFIHIQ